MTARPMVQCHSPSQRGFALLIVLLAMAFLALLGSQIVTAGRMDTRLAGNLKSAAELEAGADGAIEHVMFALLARDPDIRLDGAPHLLRIGAVPVEVRVENEDGRINLNTASGPLLTAFLAELGTPPAQAVQLSAAILDWRTASGTPRPGGAKAPQYRAAGLPYGPPGSPFESVDELRLVLGVTPALFARMAPHVTVWTDGDPDLSTYDPVVARALVDASGSQAADGDVAGSETAADMVVRVQASAIGPARARHRVIAVVTGDFQTPRPRVRILSYKQCFGDGDCP